MDAMSTPNDELEDRVDQHDDAFKIYDKQVSELRSEVENLKKANQTIASILAGLEILVYRDAAMNSSKKTALRTVLEGLKEIKAPNFPGSGGREF